MSSRPWSVAPENWSTCMNLFPQWLKERGGIIVYENHTFDSSSFGDKTFMPARFIAAEDNKLHDAPNEHRLNGGLPSLRQQKVDHIKLEDFSDVEAALECFFKEENDNGSK